MNPSSSLMLILEIQSGLVNAAIVSPSDAGHIVRSVSVPITEGPHRDSAHLLARMKRTLSETLKSLPDAHSVSRVDCILSSPWITSRTKSVKVTFVKNTLITKKLVGMVISSEREKMKDASIIEQKIFEIKINGYPIADIDGQKGRELEVFFAVSMSSEAILDDIREVVAKHAGLGVASRMAYHSSLLLSYAASRETNGNETNYILGHIHGELSDIAVVKKGVTTLIASFPFGYASLGREVSKTLGEPEPAVRSKLALHASKSLHRQETERLSTAIDSVMRDQWADQFLKSITIAGESLPYAVFLAVPQEYYPHFKKALEDTKADKDAPQEKEGGFLHKAHLFMVNHINTGLIHSILRL